MRSNLILFVLVLVLVLVDQAEFYMGLGTRDEYEDDDEVCTLKPRMKLHENDIGFHEVSHEGF